MARVTAGTSTLQKKFNFSSFSPLYFGEIFEDTVLADETFLFLLEYLSCALVAVVYSYAYRAFQFSIFTSNIVFQPHSNPCKEGTYIIPIFQKKKN